MKIISATASEFLVAQEAFLTSNILQSHQIAELQEERNHYNKVERLLFLEDEQVIGLAVVDYRKKWKYFQEALVIQGPVLDYSNPSLVVQAIQSLEHHVRQQQAISLMCHPYLINQRKDENLAIISQHESQEIADVFRRLSYNRYFDSDYLFNGMMQVFLKDLRPYRNYQEIEASFSNSLRRNIKKYRNSHVKVKELTATEIPLFYDILQQTSHRKSFSIQDLSFFETLKDKLGDQAKFMYAYLDCASYQTYLKDHINRYQEEIKDLESKADSKKRNTAIKNATQQLTSYQKRWQEFQKLQVKTDHLPLSSYLFIDYGDELLSYFGGNIQEYFIFGGATLINCDMIRYAKESGLSYFNFGGTIEVDQSQEGTGNFNYKKQFGGQLVQYLGSFTKPLTLVGKCLLFMSTTFKKQHR